MFAADGLGHRTTRTYDFDGNLTALIDPGHNETDFAYDPDNRVTLTTNPFGGTAQLAGRW